MHGFMNAMLLLADDSVAANPTMKAVIALSILLATILIPTMLVGPFVTKKLRMRDHGSKIGFSLLTVTAAIMIIATSNGPRYGVDLEGGVILIYNANLEGDNDSNKSGDDEEEAGARPRVTAADLAAALGPRINPSGTKEIVIRPYGDSQIEIIVPNVGNQEIEDIKEKIKNAGILVFRIVANQTDHQAIITLAKEQADNPQATLRTNKNVGSKDASVGRWVAAGRDDKATDSEVRKLKQDWTRYTLRDGVTGKIVPRAPVGSQFKETNTDYEEWLAAQGIEKLEVLVVLPGNDKLDVHGDHLGMITKDYDELTNLCVAFSLNQRGAMRMGALTSSNMPDPATGTERQLGIVLDDTLLSAPNIQTTITNRGRITGRFSTEEIDFLINILRAGRLPAALDPIPATENVIGPTLGQDTIDKGAKSIVISLIAVLVFIAFYYRFSGIVACVVLLLNILFTFALIILISAPLTLPGLAGLVLTVGMSVDANVLIFERIREELLKGAKLKLAVRQGFERATRTIVDANVTTLITAIVLYAIGTDQVRGFATMLILGILMCMFSAIYIARLIFDIAVHCNWVTELKMRSIMGKTDVDFVGKRVPAAALSILLIVVGMIAVVARGPEIFDIDFNGGTSVMVASNGDETSDEVRDLLVSRADEMSADKRVDITVTSVQIDVDEYKDKKVWQIVTSLPTESEIKKLVGGEIEGADDKVDVERFTMEQVGSFSSGSADVPPSDVPPSDVPPSDDCQDETDADGATPIGDELASQVTVVALKFSHEIVSTSLVSSFERAAEKLNVGLPGVVVEPPAGVDIEDHDMKEWTVTVGLDSAATELVLTEVTSDLNNKPNWISASTIGGKVAGKTQSMAIAALAASIIGIVIYVWIRFQKIVFGLAAVVALVHDVLITLGAIALSAWLADAFGFLLIEEFRISLPVVAAFLTIIGYSLNDTIVVFDRIREVRGKSPDLTFEMVNTSINQTLSRTILTSLTTLLVVLILYSIGGQGIHAFAFALIIGVAVGTYSSIFVASPALLFMMDVVTKREAARKAAR